MQRAGNLNDYRSYYNIEKEKTPSSTSTSTHAIIQEYLDEEARGRKVVTTQAPLSPLSRAKEALRNDNRMGKKLILSAKKVRTVLQRTFGRKLM